MALLLAVVFHLTSTRVLAVLLLAELGRCCNTHRNKPRGRKICGKVYGSQLGISSWKLLLLSCFKLSSRYSCSCLIRSIYANIVNRLSIDIYQPRSYISSKKSLILLHINTEKYSSDHSSPLHLVNKANITIITSNRDRDSSTLYLNISIWLSLLFK